MSQVSSLTDAEIERYVESVRRRHGRKGLLILAEICNRALQNASPPDAVNGRRRFSLIGP